MSQSSGIRQQLAVWGLILALWCLLVFAFAGQLFFTGSLEWPLALRLSLRDWFPWAILSPGVIWLASRFPLERPKLPFSVPVHLVACMAAVVICELLTRPLAGQGPGGVPQFSPRDGLRQERPPFPPNPPLPGNLPAEGAPNRPLPPRPPGNRPFAVEGLVNRAKFNLPVYWILVCIVQALTYYGRLQERERKAAELEARLAEAKLQALRMQLHPHFLFNTLNAVSALVHKDPDAADEMIGNLSELLRLTLDTTDQEVPLRRELEFLDRYLEIQQTRFGDRLRIEKEIDMAALEGRVPTFILQPLVENAVRHGIELQPGIGRLQIRAGRDGDSLRLSVHDNGAGPKPHAKGSEGIGLANTRARLQELYGNRARLTLTSLSEGGFAVQLEIPYREQPVAARPALSAAP